MEQLEKDRIWSKEHHSSIKLINQLDFLIIYLFATEADILIFIKICYSY